MEMPLLKIPIKLGFAIKKYKNKMKKKKNREEERKRKKKIKDVKWWATKVSSMKRCAFWWKHENMKRR